MSADIRLDIAITDGPKWLSHVEITVEDGQVEMRLVKISGHDYGSAVLSTKKLRTFLDMCEGPEDKGKRKKK